MVIIVDQMQLEWPLTGRDGELPGEGDGLLGLGRRMPGLVISLLSIDV